MYCDSIVCFGAFHCYGIGIRLTFFQKQVGTKTASMPTQNILRLTCRDAIFVANLRTFLAYNLQAEKCGDVQIWGMSFAFVSLKIWVARIFSRVQSSEQHCTKFVCELVAVDCIAENLAEKGGNQCHLPTQFGAVQPFHIFWERRICF